MAVDRDANGELPPLMLPAYERNRWPATLFFGSFLALGMFFS